MRARVFRHRVVLVSCTLATLNVLIFAGRVLHDLAHSDRFTHRDLTQHRA